MPTVSVIMTFKNGLPWIHDAIQSVVDQTYSDWELIMVDDGSVDGSARAVVERWGRDARMRVIQPGTVGRGKALNLAVSHARGQWIANLDCDDLFHPRKLEFQLAAASQEDGKSFFFTRTSVIDLNTAIKWKDVAEESDIRDLTARMIRRDYVCHSSFFTSTSLLKTVGGYDEKRPSQIDYELWLRLISRGGRVLLDKRCLTAKRIHAKQSFEARNHLRYIYSCLLLQLRFAKNTKVNFLDYLYIVTKFAYGLLPRGLRALRWRL